MISNCEMINGRTIVVEPSNGGHYEVSIWQNATVHSTSNEIWCIALADGSCHCAFTLTYQNLQAGWASIKGMDVHDRVETPMVYWLAEGKNLNPYTVAAVYEAWGSYWEANDDYDDR